MNRFLKTSLRSLVIRTLLARERLESGISFSLISPELHADPYRWYRRLQIKDAVHRSRLFNGWILSKYADVDAVLRDHKRFANDSNNASDNPLDAQDIPTRSMLYRDPPDHTRLRSLVSKAFTPRSIDALRPRVEMIVDELLDSVGDAESFDVIDALAYPLPVIVIAEMLGIPPEDRDRFRGWSNDVAHSLEPLQSEEDSRRAQRSVEELREYLSAIIEQRRLQPRDDLISALTAAEDEGDKLTHEELLLTLVLLLVAGNETTKNLIGNGLLALLRHPDELKKLRENPDLIEPAIDELLRLDSPVQIDGRTALEDVMIGGKQVKRGQRVVLLIGAANRDPDVFSDPDRLDLSREAKNHISFGRGIHHCLGAPLARIEGQIAFRKLIERFPDIRLDETPQFRNQVVLRGMKSLRGCLRSISCR